MRRLVLTGIAGLVGAFSLHAAENTPAPAKRPLTLEEQIQARGALLVDASSGRVLFARDTTTPYAPASTTKMLTALIAYEHCGLDEIIRVRPEATRVEPSHVPLVVGDRLVMRDALNALLIGSDNDVAVAIAQHVGGSVEGFVELMNRRAEQLGCTSSHFQNPNGLSAPGHYSTCEDMLKIFRKTVSYPFLRQVMRTQTFVLKTETGTHNIKNHNLLLGKYPGMGPAKTGWTSAARHTYAAAASENGRELQLILLRSENKWKDARILFDWAFGRKPVTPPTARRTTASVTPADR